jgi:hypothetical protein
MGGREVVDRGGRVRPGQRAGEGAAWAWVVLLAASAAFAAMVWALSTWPFTDVPFRMAAATIERGQHGSPGPLTGYFSTTIGVFTPTMLFTLVAGSPLWPSVETATRVLLASYLISVPLLVALLIRRLGGQVWLAVLSLVVLFNFNLATGLLEFVLGIPVILLLLHALVSFDRSGSRMAAAAMAALLALLFWVHALVMLFGVLLVLLYVATSRTRRTTVAMACVLVPALALFAGWWLGRPNDGGVSGELWKYYSTSYLRTFGLRKGILINDNRQLYPERFGTGTAAALALVILGHAAVALVRTARRVRWSTPGRRVIALFAVSALASVLLLPDRLTGEPSIFERFSVFLMIGAVLVAGVTWPGRISRRHVAALSLGALLYVGMRAEYFVAFARDAQDFNRALLPEAGAGNTLLGLVYDWGFRGHPTYNAFPNYFIVWKQGIAATELTTFRFYVVHASPGAPWLPRYRPYPNPRSYQPADLATAYVLVRGPIPPELPVERDYSLVRAAGPWRLYSKRP